LIIFASIYIQFRISLLVYMDRLFYIVFNSYYKHGTYKNDIPPLTVFGIFCIAIFSNLLLLRDVILLLNDPMYFRTHKASGIIPYLIASAIITYFTFYYRKRYVKIYERYCHITLYNGILAKMIAFTLMIFLISLPILFALLYNKFYFGNWI